MTKIASYISLLLLVVTLFSCEKEVDDIVIPYTKQLVVETYLCPQDSLIQVRVTSNEPSIGIVTNSYGIATMSMSNALVILSDGEQRKIIKFSKRKQVSPYSSEDNYYLYGYFLNTKEFPIRAGKTYTLTVTAPDYPATKATCTVPESKVDKETIQIIKGSLATTQWHPKLTWKDVKGEENYYNISLYYTFKTEYRGPDLKGVWQIVTSEAGIYPALFERDAYLSDYGLDGQVFTKEGSAYYYDLAIPADTSFGYAVVRDQKIVANVAAISKEFYAYQVKLIKQRDSQGNPFAEPVQLTGNIEGGLGFFGAYNRTEVVLDLKK